MNYKELVIIIALLVLLAVSIYQAYTVASLKAIVEKKLASGQTSSLGFTQNPSPYPGFEGIPTTGQGCVV